MQKTIKLVVSGKVQGVFYRQSTKQKALSLGLDGHAINLTNGDVEVLVKGTDEAISELVSWCHIGPQAAVVEKVTTEESVQNVAKGFITG